MDVLCDLCGPLCGLCAILPCKCRCCDNLCGDPLEGFFNIPESDLEILRVQHKPDTYYLMTAAKRKPYEQRAALLSFDQEVLDSIPPADRLVFTDVKKGVEANDAQFDALKLLMKGIQDHEARYILGGDTVSVDGLAAQGITTSAQLRARKANAQS